ncbi:MAG: MBL fold metallo-hydrolase, partial [Actinomycetales bacterium]
MRFLGTGAAGGWPNPYCSCSSCCQERVAGRARSSTSLLIDGLILLDCGPAAIDGARTLHQSLAEVEHVVITHGHPDHLSPAFLLFRHWAHGPDGASMPPLHLWAPPLALASCEPWIAPDELGRTVHLHPIVAGDEQTLRTRTSDYCLRMLPASHDLASSTHGGTPADPLAGEAVLLDL